MLLPRSSSRQRIRHEVSRVAWKPLDEITAMYASHHDWLCKVREMLPVVEAKRRLVTLVRESPDAPWAVAFKASGLEAGLVEPELEGPPSKKPRA